MRTFDHVPISGCCKAASTRRRLSSLATRTPYARSELVLKLEEVFREKAKENQGHGMTAPGKTLCQNSDKASPVDTKRELAELARVSHDTIAKVKALVERHGIDAP